MVDNLKALEVIPKLTPEIMERIEGILGNKPKDVELFTTDESIYTRPVLDPNSRVLY